MIFRQRLSFRLTPLLDLLLIVLFAQFLEIQQTTAEPDRTSVREADTSAAETDARARILRLERSLEDSRTAHADEMREHAMREVRLRAALDRAEEQQRTIGEMVGELFRIPADVVEAALVPGNLPGRTPEEIERLRQDFQDLAGRRGREVFEHLVAFEELTKRSEIWKLTVEAENSITLEAAGGTHTFRARTPIEFVERFFRQYKRLPQPKSLVLVLVIYRDQATADTLFSVQQGLAPALDRMRQDSDRRTRFEYAELGYVDPRDPDSDSGETP